MLVHQIFGLMGDTEMPKLFRDCHSKVKDWCKENNHNLKLWLEEDCNKLIEEYPEFIDTYWNVRQTIMKVDIIRYLILHKYGGLYMDLDIVPNCSIGSLPKLKIGCRPRRTNFIEMEVIGSPKENEILLDYLRYCQKQIIIKDKLPIYKIWKARYIYQTTGPRSLARFLKDKEYDKWTMNLSQHTKIKNVGGIIGNEDFFSFPSCSYMDKLK